MNRGPRQGLERRRGCGRVCELPGSLQSVSHRGALAATTTAAATSPGRTAAKAIIPAHEALHRAACERLLSPARRDSGPRMRTASISRALVRCALRRQRRAPARRAVQGTASWRRGPLLPAGAAPPGPSAGPTLSSVRGPSPAAPRSTSGGGRAAETGSRSGWRENRPKRSAARR